MESSERSPLTCRLSWLRLVTEDGRVKVMDFGIAKVLGVGGRTRTGASMGTPAYMAPEQIKGAKHVDARADIYALGITIYDMLAGRTPFEAQVDTESDYELMSAQVQQAPPDPRSFYPAIPAHVVTVLMRALTKQPEQRLAGTREFLLALESAAGMIGESGQALNHPLAAPTGQTPVGAQPARAAGLVREPARALEMPAVSPASHAPQSAQPIGAGGTSAPTLLEQQVSRVRLHLPRNPRYGRRLNRCPSS